MGWSGGRGDGGDQRGSHVCSEHHRSGATRHKLLGPHVRLPEILQNHPKVKKCGVVLKSHFNTAHFQGTGLSHQTFSEKDS